MRNTHRGGDQRQRDPEGRPTQTSDLEKNTQAGISTDPQTSPGHTPSPSQPVPQRTPQKEATGTVLARRVEPQTPGGPGTRAQGTIPDPGSARREAHTKRQPGQQEQAPPVRTVTPDHPTTTRALAPHTHGATAPHPQAPGPRPAAPHPVPAAWARSAHQLQAAEGDKRAAPAALAHGSRGRAGRPPRRLLSSAAAASSAPHGLRVLPVGRPGRRGREPTAGPGSAGSPGLGRPARAPSPWSVRPRAGSAAPRLLCLSRRPPGAPLAAGPLAGSAEQGAQAQSAGQRRTALPSWGGCPGAQRPRLPSPTTWLCRGRSQREGRTEGRGGEGRGVVGRSGRESGGEVGRGREVESWGTGRE